MKLSCGEIEPGIRIGNFLIGSRKEEVTSKLEDNYKVWEREDGFCIYTLDNFRLWFGVNGELEQIGVSKGFLGNYKSICIGSNMQDVMTRFGKYENDGDVYLISGLDGICFELEDVDDWEELTAPIEWIFVYKC
ncbi:MAG: hypothetical protein IJA34_15410 [Lachnospiraceae bacterium]|nr:hypothetical protein [Lachnospiraceae bacterium]